MGGVCASRPCETNQFCPDNLEFRALPDHPVLPCCGDAFKERDAALYTHYAQTFRAARDDSESALWELAAGLRADVENWRECAEEESMEEFSRPGLARTGLGQGEVFATVIFDKPGLVATVSGEEASLPKLSSETNPAGSCSTCSPIDTFRSSPCTSEPSQSSLSDSMQLVQLQKQSLMERKVVDEESAQPEKSYCSIGVQTEEPQSEIKRKCEFNIKVEEREQQAQPKDSKVAMLFTETNFDVGRVASRSSSDCNFCERGVGIERQTGKKADNEEYNFRPEAITEAENFRPEAICELELEARREVKSEVITSGAEEQEAQDELAEQHPASAQADQHPTGNVITVTVTRKDELFSLAHLQSEFPTPERSEVEVVGSETTPEKTSANPERHGQPVVELKAKEQNKPWHYDADAAETVTETAPTVQWAARETAAVQESPFPEAAMKEISRSASRSPSRDFLVPAETCLDGVWSTRDGEAVADVKGSTLLFLGDAMGMTSQIISLGGGVFSLCFDDEEFLGDVEEGEDGLLMLHWSDGETWVRRKEEQDDSEDESDSSSSSSSNTTLSSFLMETNNMEVRASDAAAPVESHPQIEEW